MKLKAACELMGIEAILCDLDDTLVFTNRIFMTQIKRFCEGVIACHPHISLNNLRSRVDALNVSIFKDRGAQSSNWDLVAEQLVKEYGDDLVGPIESSLVYLRQIYLTLPEPRPGALEFLIEVNRNKIPIGIITHSSVEWTHRKITGNNFDFFIDTLRVVPEDSHKTAKEWNISIEELGVGAAKVLAIGDSIPTDMIPSFEAGVEKRIWMDRLDGWDHYRKGNLPIGTLTVKEMTEVIPLIESLPWA